MKNLLAFPIVFLSISSMVTCAQETILPAEAKPFVLQGYEMLDYVTDDLNGDQKPDAILILKTFGEDTLMDAETARPFLILLRQANGQLKQVLRNDHVILCRFCGGVFGDPYNAVEIAGKGFTLSFYGGNSWRWGYNYRFEYRPAKNNWYLVKETQTSFQAGDPEATMKETEIEESELGGITLDKFDSNPAYEDSRWRVKAVKTFFYDNPKPGSKPRKAYLLKGNIATGIRQLKNFIEVSFTDSKDHITTGFLLRKDLEKVQ